jgi:hypothetical protein
MVDELRRFMRSRLPDHTVSSDYLVVDAFLLCFRHTRVIIMWETFNCAPSFRVLQCVDPSLGLHFTLDSKMRASKTGVSFVGTCPA